jgi:hypothetical protein
VQVRNRETGELLEAEIVTEEWSRSIPSRGVTRAAPGDYCLTDEKGEKWGIRAVNLPLLFETVN